jgi:TetR/AcrR family transcriptional regulator of autoinduction and epiphytic fitness
MGGPDPADLVSLARAFVQHFRLETTVIPTEAKQARAISAARRLFLERGYVGTSTEAVALEARIAKQTLYAYYPSKAGLFAAVLRDLTVERCGGPVQLPPDLARPRDETMLRRALRHVVRRVAAAMFQPECIALLRVIIAEAPRVPDLGALFRSVVPDHTLGVVAGVLRVAAVGGLTRQTDPENAATLLVGSLVLRVMRDALLMPVGRALPPRPDQLDELVEQFLLGAASSRGAAPSRAGYT